MPVVGVIQKEIYHTLKPVLKKLSMLNRLSKLWQRTPSPRNQKWNTTNSPIKYDLIKTKVSRIKEGVDVEEAQTSGQTHLDKTREIIKTYLYMTPVTH